MSEKDINDYVLVHSHFVKHNVDHDRYRCIRINKDNQSMLPTIKPGSLVCIDSKQNNSKALDGKIVALKNDDKGCSIRKLKIEKNCLVGIPEKISQAEDPQAEQAVLTEADRGEDREPAQRPQVFSGWSFKSQPGKAQP